MSCSSATVTSRPSATSSRSSGPGQMLSRWISGFQTVGLGSTAPAPTGLRHLRRPRGRVPRRGGRAPQGADPRAVAGRCHRHVALHQAGGLPPGPHRRHRRLRHRPAAGQRHGRGPVGRPGRLRRRAVDPQPAGRRRPGRPVRRPRRQRRPRCALAAAPAPRGRRRCRHRPRRHHRARHRPGRGRLCRRPRARRPARRSGRRRRPGAGRRASAVRSSPSCCSCRGASRPPTAGRPWSG